MEKATEKTDKPKNKVAIGRLVNFINAANKWGELNQNNKLTPLGKCIRDVMFDVDAHVKAWRDEVDQYNTGIKDIKIKHATTVKITENSQAPNQEIIEYNYQSSELIAQRQEINATFAKFQTVIKAIEETEVEIGVEYVKAVPNDNILPTDFITAFRGIVIDPTWIPTTLMGKA